MVFILIYVTHKNLEDARIITSYLLDKKLIAGVNFIPIEAVYWLKDKLDSTNSFVSLLKTRSENWVIVRDEIKKLHPDKVPCIIKMDVEANVCFERRILNSTVSVNKK